ncbi:alpha/beta hydrolase [Lentilactobacillus sp. Marseille-Q4993]|uniref:alpha/beta hydrolase n=1 Tax=Lentilactobacillus sp. Marseille-Q4993 TaxID=3039492 RepID=UPI0024BC722E|nr:alpha/beta hydrolase [Lentilactobacillus sp. Marseille-Q4993]
MKIESVSLEEKNSSLDMYISNSDVKLPGIVIIAGGSYNPIKERDSERVALSYATHAYQAFVVQYPVGENKSYATAKVAIAQSFDYIVSHADELNVDTDNLGIIGFSAGGQLAAAYANSEGNHAKFEILGYPVIKPTLDEKMGVTTEDVSKMVSANTPRTFIFGSINDELTPFGNHILSYVQELDKNNVKFELHEFGTGNHGISLANKYTGIVNGDRTDEHFSKWFELSVDWLNN